MLNLYFTVDVEIWCSGWDNLDQKFPDAFKKYVYGKTSKGDFGLPYKLKVLSDNGLRGVFFVEPLFSLRFGNDPLSEIIGIIREAGHDVEMHLHSEWVDEIDHPDLPKINSKRQFLRDFNQDEQEQLIRAGIKIFRNNGISEISAFRAGGFGFNIDTLEALKKNEIFIDSSYNASVRGRDSNLMPGTLVTEPLQYNGVHEVPMTVFADKPGNLRHAQLCACSFREMEGLLWSALENDWNHLVFLSHNFELLNSSMTQPNTVVLKRFHQLCHFLQKNMDCFKTGSFSNYKQPDSATQRQPLKSPVWKTGLRTLEQLRSRFS